LKEGVAVKSFAILGIGHFGFYLGWHLYEKGHEVIAVDINKMAVQKIKDKVSLAVVADASERDTLVALGIGGVDTAVVCIGTRMQASILTTLQLKEIGVKNIIAKATSEDYGLILKKIGANQVFFPEKDLAMGLATRLDNPNMLDYVPFMEGYSIVELLPPKPFLGKTLKELDLINRFGIQALAVKGRTPKDLTLIPTAAYRVKESDNLIVLGPDDSLKKLQAL
jgi:trk system potassium uptake protein TrkA